MTRRTLAGAPELSYLEAGSGDGRPLVLLHGLSGSADTWSDVIAAHAPTRRVVALDLRGHGHSGRAPNGYRIDGYTADARRLLTHVGEEAIVVGHSLGGLVAARLAQDGAPAPVAVLLEDPPLYLGHKPTWDATPFATIFPAMRAMVRSMQAAGVTHEDWVDAVASAPAPAGGTRGEHTVPALLAARATGLAQLDAATWDPAIDASLFDGFDPDAPLRCPTLVLRADPALGPAFAPEHADRFLGANPTAEIVEMSGCDHSIHASRTGAPRFAELLADFVDDHDR